MGIINPFESKMDTDGPEIRLLVCSNCRTVEPLDDYQGPPERAEELDVELNRALDKHRDGVERRRHVGQLFRVKRSAWTNPATRDQIGKQIISRLDPNAETGLGGEAYAMKDNYSADAMACWEAHLKTPACSDYKSPSKLLVPDTAAERKELGMPKFDPGNPATQRFLCEYCPVHSLVTQMQRKKAGLYDQ